MMYVRFSVLLLLLLLLLLGTLRFATVSCFYGYEKSNSHVVMSARALQYSFSAVGCFSTTAKYFIL